MNKLQLFLHSLKNTGVCSFSLNSGVLLLPAITLSHLHFFKGIYLESVASGFSKDSI